MPKSTNLGIFLHFTPFLEWYFISCYSSAIFENNHVTLLIYLITRKIGRFGRVRDAAYTRIIATSVAELGNGIFSHLEAIVVSVAAYMCVYHVMGRHDFGHWVSYFLEAEEVGIFGQALYPFIRIVTARCILNGITKNISDVINIFVE